MAGAAIVLTLVGGCAAAPALSTANKAPTPPARAASASATLTSGTPSAPPPTTSAARTTTATPQPLRFEQRLLALAFADPQHGMVITRSCDAGTCAEHAVTTDDGGVSWHVAGAAPAPAPDESYGVQLLLPDPSDAWFLDASTAGRAKVWASHDGGATWNRIDAPGTVTWMTTIGGELWISDTGACHQPAHGPATCHPAIDVAPATANQVTTLSRPPTRGLPLIGAAAGPGGQRFVAAGYLGGGANVLLASPDGGRTWRPLSDPCGPLDAELAASPASPQLWALCAGEPGAGAERKHLFVSDNGGAHWTRQPDPSYSGYSTDLAVFSSTVAWLSGSDRGDVYRTTDGGSTWRDVLAGRVGDAAGAPAYGFDAIDGSHAVVAVSGSVDGHPLFLRTADGGRTWQPLAVPF